MGSTPLTIAAIAGALLLVSVVGDLAFSQSLSLEAGKSEAALQLVGQGSADGRLSDPVSLLDPIEVNRTDTLSLRVRLENGYPWSTSQAYTLRTDGCYAGGRVIALLDVDAPARGVGSTTTEVNVGTLLNATGYRQPKPVGLEDLNVFLSLCKGERTVLYANIPIQEVAS